MRSNGQATPISVPRRAQLLANADACAALSKPLNHLVVNQDVYSGLCVHGRELSEIPSAVCIEANAHAWRGKYGIKYLARVSDEKP